ncbi:hypothetical protein KKF61_06220 [Patescibacteria group bacterium]|nr:hypothetical protein [Patescibacteria group bacterium]
MKRYQNLIMAALGAALLALFLASCSAGTASARKGISCAGGYCSAPLTEKEKENRKFIMGDEFRLTKHYADLSKSAYEFLDSVVVILGIAPDDYYVRITGSAGPDESEHLAGTRAGLAYNYLASKGVPTDKLVIKRCQSKPAVYVTLTNCQTGR